MQTTELIDRLESALEDEAQTRGLELVGVEQSGGRHKPIIRVLIDRQGGIDIDTIAQANGWVSEILDAEPGLSGPYVLEVSSPGIDRPLRKPADFERFVGQTAKVKTRTHEGRLSYTGTIVNTTPAGIVLRTDTGEEFSIAFDDIAKARLKGEIDFGTGRSAQTR